MKKALVIFSTFVTIQAFSQITVNGRIIDKMEEVGIPGVNILEKGTNNGTVSDLEGYFSIELVDSFSFLEFSFVGYKVQNVQIEDTNYLLVKLKPDCIIDFFDYNDICIGISSGTFNDILGGYGYINFVFLKLLALHGAVNFQTDLTQNHKLDIDFGTLHLFADCGYDADIRINYRYIENEDFTFNSYLFEGKLNFSRPNILGQYSTLFLGYGLSDLSKSTTNLYNSSGILFGFGKRIYRPLSLNFNLKTIYWQDYWEYIAELICRYKDFEFITDYNIIDSYRELNLRFGYIINY